MTWVTEADVVPNHSIDDPSLRIEEEVAPGVIFERRMLMQVSAATAAALLFGSPNVGRAQSSRSEATEPSSSESDFELTWEQFLEQCVPMVKPLYEQKTLVGQDAYLFAIASQAVRISGVPVGDMRALRQFDPKYEFEMCHQGFPFFVVHWRMEPNAILPAHCHPGTSVCTVGLEGETLVRNFEPQPGSPPYSDKDQKPFLIRETRSELISPRRISTLSESRDNIHYFVAGPQGARGIDITTQHQGDGTFSFLKFDANRPADAKQRLFEAVWVGSDLQTSD